MLISEIFHFFAKTIFSEKFEHTVGFVLNNSIIDENFVGFCWIISRGCPETAIFVQKKAIFNG